MLAELRTRPPAGARQLPGETPSWPLDDGARSAQPVAGGKQTALRLLSALLRCRKGPLHCPTRPASVPDTAVETEYVPAAAEPPQRGRLARVALIAVAVLVIVAGGFVGVLERDVRASAERMDESQRQARLAADAASRQVAETAAGRS